MRERSEIERRIAQIRAELDGIVSSVDRALLILELRDLEVERAKLPSRRAVNDAEGVIFADGGDVAANPCPGIPEASRQKLRIPPAIYVLTVLSSLSLSSYMFFGAILFGIVVCAYLIAIT